MTRADPQSSVAFQRPNLDLASLEVDREERTKYRTKPARVGTSTLKKSVAAIAPQ